MEVQLIQEYLLKPDEITALMGPSLIEGGRLVYASVKNHSLILKFVGGLEVDFASLSPCSESAEKIRQLAGSHT